MKPAMFLLTILFALPAVAKPLPVTKDALTKAPWQGTMVLVVNEQTTVMPITLTFKVNGQLTLESTFEKPQTQRWSWDAKTKTITLNKPDGSLDVILSDVLMSTGGPGGRYASMTARFSPGNAKAKVPPGMSMTLYLSRLK